MSTRMEILWTSEPMRIEGHEWRIGVGTFLILGDLCRCSFYQWRNPIMCGQIQPWREESEWPTYDDHHAYHGTPEATARLWSRNRSTLEAFFPPIKTYRTELTPAGEQMVIPGCERDAAPGVRQLSLF